MVLFILWGGGVTSVNGKTGAVTVKEPTQKYIHYYEFNQNRAMAPNGATPFCCLFYIISTASPIDANLTSLSDFRSLLLQECTSDTPAICCNGMFDKITNNGGGIPKYFYVDSSDVHFYMFWPDYSKAGAILSHVPISLTTFLNNTKYLYSVPLS